MNELKCYVHIMNVHGMNGEKPDNQENYRSLMLLDELAKGEPVSQRDLSKRLGIALGLVNSYLKNLASKGYVTISQIPAKRYAYYLTPKGFAEKTRLTYHLLQDYTSIYRNARRDFKRLFEQLHGSGVRSVVFAGVDEVAEIAYLSLQEMDISLEGVFDDDRAGKQFFKNTILSLKEITDISDINIVLTTFLKREEVYQSLIGHGIAPDRILSIYGVAPMSRDRRSLPIQS